MVKRPKTKPKEKCPECGEVGEWAWVEPIGWTVVFGGKSCKKECELRQMSEIMIGKVNEILYRKEVS